MQRADVEKLESGKYSLDIVDKESLEESKKFKVYWDTVFNFRPKSIWNIPTKANFGQDKKLEELIYPTSVASGTYITGNLSKGMVLVPKEPALSQFPLELGIRIVKFWSEKGDLIFDPFSGMGERMQISAYLGRNYIGYDVSKKFHKENLNMIEKTPLLNKVKRELYLKDSRENLLEDKTIDFIYTSPPYYDIAVEGYGDEDEQLGKSNTYEKFLDEYKKIIKHCFRVLKDGKFCVFVIGDFRKDKKYIPFHCDTIRIFEEVGFNLHDIIVYEVGTLSASYTRSILINRRMGKTHEYVLVFKKDGEYDWEKGIDLNSFQNVLDKW